MVPLVREVIPISARPCPAPCGPGTVGFVNTAITPREATLPKRPCFRAGIEAYQRAVDELQVGDHPRHGVVIKELSPRLVAVLRALDGRTPLSRLIARAGEQDGAKFEEVLGELVGRGLVIDAAGPPSDGCADTSVTICGDGPLAASLAWLLARSGVGHIAVQSAGTVTRSDLGVLGAHEIGRPRREAIERLIRAASSNVTVGPIPSDTSPDLVVLTDAQVPAPEVVKQLMCERQEHLVVAFRDGFGVVGPLVLPGRSSCLQCADLFRTDRDQHWPRVANQMAGRVKRAGPAATQATAALGAAQILRVLRPGREPPPVLECTIELDLQDGTTVHRYWEAHPFCECGVADP